MSIDKSKETYQRYRVRAQARAVVASRAHGIQVSGEWRGCVREMKHDGKCLIKP